MPLLSSFVFLSFVAYADHPILPFPHMRLCSTEPIKVSSVM